MKMKTSNIAISFDFAFGDLLCYTYTAMCDNQLIGVVLDACHVAGYDKMCMLLIENGYDILDDSDAWMTAEG